jgi:hypothetical protein
MTKKTLTAKVSPKTLDRLEDYADREQLSKSESADRLIKQGLDVEESDMRLVPVRSDGGTVIEDRLDQIESQQQNRLDEIDRKVEASLEDEPSWLIEWLETMRISAAGLTLGGVVAYILSAIGQLSLSPSLAFWFIGINTVFLLTFLFIQEVVE